MSPTIISLFLMLIESSAKSAFVNDGAGSIVTRRCRVISAVAFVGK